MISSVHNPKVKWVRELQAHSSARREQGLFVVEGVRLAEEALAFGAAARLVLYSPGLSERGQHVVEGYTRPGASVEECSPHVLAAASDTQTPQGILAVLPIPVLQPVSPLDFVLVPDGLRDPGNLGTLLRTAAAAGVQAAWIPPGSADVFAPKVVRAAMGAHFRLPLRSLTWEQIAETSTQAGLRLFLADAQGELEHTQADLRLPLALILGGEASGAGQAAHQLASARLRIAMPGKIESLNAAAAAAILLFEVVRQRSAMIRR